MQLNAGCNGQKTATEYNSSLSVTNYNYGRLSSHTLQLPTVCPSACVSPSSWSYCIHLLCLVLVLVLPVRARRPRDAPPQQGQQAGLQKEGGTEGGEEVQQSNPHAATDNNCNKKDS